MPMPHRDKSISASDRPQLGHANLTAEAHAELTWFFNEALQAIEEPSNFCALVAGASSSSTGAVEDRIEALHAAGKINGWLEAIPTSSMRMLGGIYTERPWPPRLERVLGSLTGAVECLPVVRAGYLRALMKGDTTTRSVAAWLEELVTRGGKQALADWKREADRACTIAIGAYQHERGSRPGVVPHEEC